MALTLRVEIVSAEKQIFSGLAEQVIVPTQTGELGILPRHAPLLAALRPGLVRVFKPREAGEEFFFVSSGFLEIQPYVVTVLADSVVRDEEMDRAAAVRAMDHVKKELEKPVSKNIYDQLKAELNLQVALLRAIDETRRKTR